MNQCQTYLIFLCVSSSVFNVLVLIVNLRQRIPSALFGILSVVSLRKTKEVYKSQGI